MPPLLNLADEAAYRQHFEDSYCRAVIHTVDGVRVYFSPDRFTHAFYESTKRDNVKDAFSLVRAQRMSWIAATLANPDADCYQGWVASKRAYDPTRRVDVVYDDFVVVLGLRLSGEALRANFITCYEAENSIAKIRMSPAWSHADCLAALS